MLHALPLNTVVGPVSRDLAGDARERGKSEQEQERGSLEAIKALWIQSEFHPMPLPVFTSMGRIIPAMDVMTPVNEALNAVNLVFVLFEVWGFIGT